MKVCGRDYICAGEVRIVYLICSVPSVDCFMDISRAFAQQEALIRVVPRLPSFNIHEPLTTHQRSIKFSNKE